MSNRENKREKEEKEIKGGEESLRKCIKWGKKMRQ
jgi:hypothetical protein